MICTKCNESIPDGENFCPKCKAYYPGPPKRSRVETVLGVFGALVLVGFGISFAVWTPMALNTIKEIAGPVGLFPGLIIWGIMTLYWFYGATKVIIWLVKGYRE